MGALLELAQERVPLLLGRMTLSRVGSRSSCACAGAVVALIAAVLGGRVGVVSAGGGEQVRVRRRAGGGGAWARTVGRVHGRVRLRSSGGAGAVGGDDQDDDDDDEIEGEQARQSRQQGRGTGSAARRGAGCAHTGKQSQQSPVQIRARARRLCRGLQRARLGPVSPRPRRSPARQLPAPAAGDPLEPPLSYSQLASQASTGPIQSRESSAVV